MNKKVIMTNLGIGVVTGIFFAKKFMPKVALKKYTEACLYIAVMDDKIARLRFEGQLDQNGNPFKFQTLRESLMYRYRMHLNLHKKLSESELEAEVKLYEDMLKEEQELAM